MLEKNGSVFIKLGQHLAAMGYLLPLEWTVSGSPGWLAVGRMLIFADIDGVYSIAG